ncbi:MAG: DUF2339 domain-containing protein [Vicinamibacteria bacterium]|nr:DUF2339 domain-containing protein [Vicinamibacteria bacterium]
MEALVVVMALGLLAWMIVMTTLAIIALIRAGTLAEESARLRHDLSALDARLNALAEMGLMGSGAVAASPTPGDQDPRSPIAPPAPSRPETVPTAGDRALHSPLAACTAYTTTAKDSGAEPHSMIAVEEAIRPVPQPAEKAPQAPPDRTVTPSRAPAPSREPSRSFDWESLLGLRGAAWLGAIALVIGGALLAKWAFDENFITPAMRIGLLILMGTGALVGAELSLRRGFATTANAVSGAGVALLYIAFFAGRAVYDLFTMPLAFGLMSLVTIVACVLAVRYDAIFTVVLGLLGGFATPMLLSTGVDRPIGLFSYILLLNVGLLSLALRKRWHGLVPLALGGTFVIEMGWFGRFMSPDKALIGLGVFLLFGLLYIFLPILSRTEAAMVMRTGVVGGVVPYVFAAAVAGRSAYAHEWPLLFAFIGLLDLALLIVALLRRRIELLISAALATAIFLPLWASGNLRESSVLWGPTLAAIVLIAILNISRSVACRWAPAWGSRRSKLLDAAGLVGGAGLGSYALILVSHGLGDPPWAFLTLVAALVAVLIVRTGKARIPGVLTAGALAVALLIQAWFFSTTREASLVRNLSLPLLLPLSLSLLAVWRAREERSASCRVENEVATVVTVGTALLGLFGCLALPALGSDPLPLFAALAALTALILVSSLRRRWDLLVPGALAASALFITLWQAAYFQPIDLPVVLAGYVGFYLVFLGLPFILPASLTAPNTPSAGLWFGSAMAGPLYFFAVYEAVTAVWGKAFIGILPVLLAALSVSALAGVDRRMPLTLDAPAARLRLRYLALFAAVALGFIALAIPIQLDRQWITVGWALEAMAVYWLLGRLPHPGLRLFGTALYLAVGLRLLVNPEVLLYETRALPILNWFLYTYGVSAACCFLGARFLARVQERRAIASGAFFRRLVDAVRLLGILIVFALINIEIADYFSAGPYLDVSWERRYARDLATSAAWGLYAVVLLIIGVWRRSRALRYVGLGFLLLTVGKVFLYDLAQLTGLYRILSFFGLGAALVLVSLIYQRFVVTREEVAS